MPSESSSHLHYTPKEGYEILQQQWVPLHALYDFISSVERLLKIWQFACNLIVNLGENGMV